MRIACLRSRRSTMESGKESGGVAAPDGCSDIVIEWKAGKLLHAAGNREVGKVTAKQQAGLRHDSPQQIDHFRRECLGAVEVQVAELRIDAVRKQLRQLVGAE